MIFVKLTQLNGGDTFVEPNHVTAVTHSTVWDPDGDHEGATIPATSVYVKGGDSPLKVKETPYEVLTLFGCNSGS